MLAPVGVSSTDSATGTFLSFVFMTYNFSLFQKFTNYFHLKKLGFITENFQTLITSKQLLIHIQNFKVIRKQRKREEKSCSFFLISMETKSCKSHITISLPAPPPSGR